MAKTIKLFVGGLPPTVTKQELEHLFREFGTHLRIDLRLKEGSSLNQGYAFLLVNDPAIACRIVESEFVIRQRKLQVQFSKKVPKKQNVAPLRLYCRGIPPEVSDEELTRFFQEVADCRAAYSIKNSHGQKKGFGFIELFSRESAQTLLSIKTFKIREAHLVVEEFSRFNRAKPHAIPETTASDSKYSKYKGNSQKVLVPDFQQRNIPQSIKTVDNLNWSTSKAIFYPRSSESSGTVVWKRWDDNLKSRTTETYQNSIDRSSWSKEARSRKVPPAMAESFERPGAEPRTTHAASSKISWLHFGNFAWMHRHPLADILESARRQRHHLGNMRFNILAKISPEENAL